MAHGTVAALIVLNGQGTGLIDLVRTNPISSLFR